MWHDLRYSVRTLAKHPAFVAVAVIVLALGIGLNVALFSLVNAVLWKLPPVAEPDRLAYVYTLLKRQPDRPFVTEGPFFEFLLDHDEAFEAMTGHWGISMMLTADDETDLVRGEWVLANYFDVLGVQPALGRALRADDDSLSITEPSLVISHRLWVRRFHARPDIVGTKVRLGSWGNIPQSFTVVGVMAPEFKGLTDPWTPSDFWVTFAAGAGKDAGRLAFGIVGRLKPGLSQQQARAIVAAQREQYLDGRHVAPEHRSRAIAYPLTAIRMPFDPTAAVVPLRLAAALTIVVAVVLLISTTNIAGLLIARGISRMGEVSIRLVVGASAWRVARQLLMESLLLAALGGAAGVIGARWLLGVFVAYVPNRFSIDVAMDARVGIYTAALCLGVGVLVGVGPALRAARVDLLANLPGSGIGTMRRIRTGLRRWVVVPQVALSLVLLIVAAVHVRSLMTVELADLGYSIDRAIVLNFTRRVQPPEDRTQMKAWAEKNAAATRLMYRQLLSRLAAVGGTDGVALTTGLPLSANANPSHTAVARDQSPTGEGEGVPTSVAWVSPGYFRTMRMNVETGRDFDERDSLTTQKVALVSAEVARKLWPGRDPIGRVVAARNSFPAANEQIEWLEVVGVVNEIDPILHDVGQSPFIYRPLGQMWRMDAGTLVARVGNDPERVVQQLKQAVSGADPSAEVFRVQTMNQMAAEILYPRRMSAGILAASGVIGLLLASVGLYGLISYSLAQRLHELGVRMALGAERSDIIGMVVREGAVLGTLGAAIGGVLTYAALRLTAKYFAASPDPDAIALLFAPTVLGAVILLACYIPARRASRVDPMAVLRRL
jgi:putative ABC transport system permease protein